MYVDDFDGDGQIETLIALEKNGKYYPVNSKDEIDSLMGDKTRKQFPYYRDFAGKTMEQVFGKQALAKASLLEVTTLASGYLRNNGETFSFVPFDDEFQTAPINRFLAEDLNDDGQRGYSYCSKFSWRNSIPWAGLCRTREPCFQVMAGFWMDWKPE